MKICHLIGDSHFMSLTLNVQQFWPRHLKKNKILTFCITILESKRSQGEFTYDHWFTLWEHTRDLLYEVKLYFTINKRTTAGWKRPTSVTIIIFMWLRFDYWEWSSHGCCSTDSVLTLLPTIKPGGNTWSYMVPLSSIWIYYRTHSVVNTTYVDWIFYASK